MNRKILACNVIGFMLLVFPMSIWAQNSVVPWSTFTMGAGVSSSANTAVVSLAGEGLVGPSESEITRVESGLLVAVLRYRASLAVAEEVTLPRTYALYQNYPNPFNPSTTLRFDLPAAAEVRIVVYDLLGREVARLVDERREAGQYQLLWNSRDRLGRELPSGMYIVLMTTPQFRKSIKLVLLK